MLLGSVLDQDRSTMKKIMYHKYSYHNIRPQKDSIDPLGFFCLWLVGGLENVPLQAEEMVFLAPIHVRMFPKIVGFPPKSSIKR